MTRAVAIKGVTNVVNMTAIHVIVNDKSNVYDGNTIGGMMKTEAEWAEEVKRLCARK